MQASLVWTLQRLQPSSPWQTKPAFFIIFYPEKHWSIMRGNERFRASFFSVAGLLTKRKEDRNISSSASKALCSIKVTPAQWISMPLTGGLCPQIFGLMKPFKMLSHDFCSLVFMSGVPFLYTLSKNYCCCCCYYYYYYLLWIISENGEFVFVLGGGRCMFPKCFVPCWYDYYMWLQRNQLSQPTSPHSVNLIFFSPWWGSIQRSRVL